MLPIILKSSTPFNIFAYVPKFNFPKRLLTTTKEPLTYSISPFNLFSALNKIAENEKSTIQSLISEIDINRKSSLASSTRVFILQYYKQI